MFQAPSTTQVEEVIHPPQPVQQARQPACRAILPSTSTMRSQSATRSQPPIVIRGSSPIREVDLLAMIAPPSLNQSVASITEIDENVYMVIDSGATINVCPSFFAQDYPLYQTGGGGLVSATGQSIKQYGIKSLLFEIEKDLYTWIKFKVCEVSHVFLSVPALNRGGHHVHFGRDYTLISTVALIKIVVFSLLMLVIIIIYDQYV